MNILVLSETQGSFASASPKPSIFRNNDLLHPPFILIGQTTYLTSMRHEHLPLTPHFSAIKLIILLLFK